ncbi:unnamed protein product [Ambrosiozyma monospora]|uniref:Unnamed protein product n=1 Tax=Ambrosiozyma monospora TaxID=43982 RepID=A0ACB5TVJ8_AMBMO|nr:unnamed protein product [Ambrosiozyma monospora]
MSDLNTFINLLQPLPSDLQYHIITHALISYITSTKSYIIRDPVVHSIASSKNVYPFWDGLMQAELVHLMDPDPNTIFNDHILCPVIQNMNLHSTHISRPHFTKLVQFITTHSIKINSLYIELLNGNDDPADIAFFQYPMLTDLIQFGCHQVFVDFFPHHDIGIDSHLFYLEFVKSAIFPFYIGELKTLFTKTWTGDKPFLKLLNLSQLHVIIRNAADLTILEKLLPELRKWNGSSNSIGNQKKTLTLGIRIGFTGEEEDDFDQNEYTDESRTLLINKLSSFLHNAPADLNIQLDIYSKCDELKYPRSAQNLAQVMCSNNFNSTSLTVSGMFTNLPHISNFIKQSNKLHTLLFTSAKFLQDDGPRNIPTVLPCFENSSLKKITLKSIRYDPSQHNTIFGNLPSLKHLELDDCQITPEFFQSIPDTVTHLNIENWLSSKITTTDPISIRLPTKLRILELQCVPEQLTHVKITNCEQLTQLYKVIIDSHSHPYIDRSQLQSFITQLHDSLTSLALISTYNIERYPSPPLDDFDGLIYDRFSELSELIVHVNCAQSFDVSKLPSVQRLELKMQNGTIRGTFPFSVTDLTIHGIEFTDTATTNSTTFVEFWTQLLTPLKKIIHLSVHFKKLRTNHRHFHTTTTIPTPTPTLDMSSIQFPNSLFSLQLFFFTPPGVIKVGFIPPSLEYFALIPDDYCECVIQVCDDGTDGEGSGSSVELMKDRIDVSDEMYVNWEVLSSVKRQKISS